MIESLSTGATSNSSWAYSSNETLAYELTSGGSFSLLEAGAQESGETFAFTDYQLISGDFQNKTASSDVQWAREDWQFTPPPHQANTGHQTSSATGHGEEYSDQDATLDVQGSGPVDDFSYGHYDKTAATSSDASYLETGMFNLSEAPPNYGSWTLYESTTVEDHVDTTGSALVGLSTATFDSTQEMDRTDYMVGYPTLATYTNDASDSSSGTFALVAPEPSNVQPPIAYAVSDEAVGKNLAGAGLWDLNTANSKLVDSPSGAVTDYASKNDGSNRNASGNGTKEDGPPQLGGAGGAGNEGPGGPVAVPLPENAKRAYTETDPAKIAADRDRIRADGSADAANDAWRRNSIEALGWIGFQITGSDDWFEHLSNFFAGWGDTLSGGGTKRFRQWFNYNDAVNEQSAAYDIGGDVGFAHKMLLEVTGVGGFSMIGGGMGLAEGIANGDSDAIMAAAEALVKARLASAGSCGKLVLKGMQGLEAVNMMADAYELMQQGRTKEAAKLMIEAAVMIKQMNSCFAAGTKLWTASGYKKIEEFRKHDRLFSRSEHDPCGLIEEKVVESTFQRQAIVLNLHVQGQVIRTTAEHPFYRYGDGWTKAGSLSEGDWLLTASSQWVIVEEAFDTGELETVYNVAVADFHTYFVGDEGRGFDVWAHNSDWCQHHSDPKFMGGDTKQKTTRMKTKDHQDLHNDLNDFLRTKENAAGQHMRPQRDNSGEKIRRNFSPEERQGAMAGFYQGPGSKYPAAADDFFKQHPELKRR